MAQAKVMIPPGAICARCGKPKQDHGSVYKAACIRFRLTNDSVGATNASVMDSAALVLPRTIAVLMPDGSVEIRPVPRR